MWNVNILTLFPELFSNTLCLSVVGNALCSGIWSFSTRNIRDYGRGKHKIIDDKPFGGGCGMIARADVLAAAIEDFFLSNDYPIILPSPRGKCFTQNMAKEFSEMDGINILCSRFEGIDERVITEFNLIEISIGDYVLSSGDIAALVIIDSCVRLLDGVLSSNIAIQEESFGFGEYTNLLEYPHFTKPRIWNDKIVPDVLLSGNHKKIAQWRLEQAISKTREVRHDLWTKYLKKNEENL